MIIFTLVAARGVQQEEVKDEDAMLLKMIILMLLWCRVAVMSAVSPLAYIINMCALAYEAPEPFVGSAGSLADSD